MQRKEFIVSSCKFCVSAMLAAAFSELTSCGTPYRVMKTPIVNNSVQLPLTSFAESQLVMVRPEGWYYNIAVQKKEDNTFSAILLQCTHQENQLTPTGKGFHCNLHGSTFDKEGRVLKGPAEQPLEHYKIFIENDNLFIRVPKTP